MLVYNVGMAKAKIVDTVIRDGHTIQIYESGAEFDRTTGRLCKPATKNIIDSEKAKEYNRRYRELRAQTITEAANNAVENSSHRVNYGDMAWVAAVAEAQYIKATTPEDPKSTAAASFLFRQAGIDAEQEKNGGGSLVPDALHAAEGLINAVRGLMADAERVRGDVIDG